SLHLEVEVQETGSFAVVTELDVPRDRSNLVVRGFERLHPADAFEFRIASGIPLSGGLGSSAAAIVAGLLAADHLFELDADVRALAVELEGHPDNVAAALEGGFVICQGSEVHRFDAPMGLEAVLVIPFEAMRSEEHTSELQSQSNLGSTLFPYTTLFRSIVAGLLAADHLFELDADVRALAVELEGHPDNVAAALEGGFVICQGSEVHRFDAPMGLEAVLVIPFEAM